MILHLGFPTLARKCLRIDCNNMQADQKTKYFFSFWFYVWNVCTQLYALTRYLLTP